MGNSIVAKIKTQQTPMSVIDTEKVRSSLEAVLNSAEISGSGRLQNFLTYVVEEKLAGREHQIKGKTIAQDVYGKQIKNIAIKLPFRLSNITDARIIVRGARLLAILGPLADEIEMFPASIIKDAEDNIPF